MANKCSGAGVADMPSIFDGSPCNKHDFVDGAGVINHRAQIIMLITNRDI